MSPQVNGLNIVQNNPKPQMNTTFKANPVVTTNTLEKTPTTDTLVKPAKNKTKNALLVLGGLALAGVGIFAAVKAGKAYQQKKAIQEIEKKFADLQGDMPRVQKTFKEVFLREDLTEKEALEMLNRYKEVEKLGITGTKEEYIKALFKEANSNYGMKSIKLKIENLGKPTIGGATSPLNEYIKINPNCPIDEYWDIIHHELRHAKQHILGYNSNPELARKVIAHKDSFETSIQPEVDKYINEIIEKGFTYSEVKSKLANKYKNELNDVLRKSFGKLDSNNIPKTQKKLAEDLINSFAECDGVEYTINHDYYKKRFYEVDARFAGESIAKLFKKPFFTKS